MKKDRHNNLLWAVLSTAIVFSLVVVFDSPVYAAFRTQLGKRGLFGLSGRNWVSRQTAEFLKLSTPFFPVLVRIAPPT